MTTKESLALRETKIHHRWIPEDKITTQISQETGTDDSKKVTKRKWDANTEMNSRHFNSVKRVMDDIVTQRPLFSPVRWFCAPLNHNAGRPKPKSKMTTYMHHPPMYKVRVWQRLIVERRIHENP